MKLAPEWKSAAVVSPRWGTLDRSKTALVLIASAIFWLLVFYGETVHSMVDIWYRSETFAHGFLIAPISAWLAWQRRHVFSTLDLRPDYLALPLVAVTGFGWLFAGFAGVGVVQQYAVVLMIPLTVWAVLGRQVLREFAFPLLFLLFAVPFGEFMEGLLMEHTADFVVAALKLTGIPVYREGQLFTIPSGSWSVVEACSGLRYLIASVTVGVLYAYLTYRSFRRRAAFVAASIIVPIFANWLRAYMIVMIGHLSGMKYAVGVDHLIYGWLFFGVVMMALFWVGSFWREDGTPAPAGAAPPPPVRADPRAGAAIAGAALAAALIAAVWPVAAERLDDVRSPQVPVLQPLAGAGGWEPVSGPLTPWRPRYQEARAVLDQVFARDGRQAALQIRYYRKQRPGGQVISSQNVLVVSDSKEWKNTGESSRLLTLGDALVPAIEGRLKGGSGNLLVWRWYWIDGRFVSNHYWAKMLQAKSMLLGDGDDGAAIILYAPSEQPERARQTLQEFAEAMLPAISASLERARQARNAH